VLAAVRPYLETDHLSEWQVEQLIETGLLGQALRGLGYQTELTRCRHHHFQPPLEALAEHGRRGDFHQVLLKEVRVGQDPNKKLSLASGLAVHVPALTIDDDEHTLVYLEMLGPKQSVKANWAALVGGGKVHWLGSRRIELDGMKEHVRVQTSLPCGWNNTILIHKQASLREMNPEQPFYLLDDGRQSIPPLFYPMLNKALALPLLENWSGYLWQAGREHDLVHILDNGQGQGYAAWRVLPAAAEWQELVQAGLAADAIVF
jgi:hypothetical protein